MSLATWKAEFYSVDAADVSAEDAAAHSLRKWEGLLPEALKQHDVRLWSIYVVDRDPIDREPPCPGAVRIDSSTCALCESYWREEDSDSCATCPLSIARGGVSCSDERDDEQDDECYGDGSPWDRWCDHKDPAPMIHWLKVTVEAAKAPEAAS